MRTLLAANGSLGADVARHLADRGELDGLVLHAPAEQRDVAGLADELAVPSWTWPLDAAELDHPAPECLLSALFNHRFDDAWLALPTWRPINLHPALLPFNAGVNTNVWPLVDHTPAGTTLHVMAREIDTGPIIAQREVATYPDDTGASLYARLMDASFELFVETWPAIATIEPTPMPPGGTRHRRAELATLDPTDEELALVDRLRARTFPPYGAEFERAGTRWRVMVSIEPVDER